jgi:hypothetical protein
MGSMTGPMAPTDGGQGAKVGAKGANETRTAADVAPSDAPDATTSPVPTSKDDWAVELWSRMP